MNEHYVSMIPAATGYRVAYLSVDETSVVYVPVVAWGLMKVRERHPDEVAAPLIIHGDALVRAGFDDDMFLAVLPPGKSITPEGHQYDD